MSAPKLKPFTHEHIPLFYEWAKKEHVKNTWFVEGYKSVEAIAELVNPNGYDYPCIIEFENKPIGYLLYCDLAAYRRLNPNPKDVFSEDVEGTYCLDLFIAEEEYLNRGIGTQTVKNLVDMLFSKYHASRIVIDPSAENRRAIRCYEKVGFNIIDEKHDGVTTCVIMELKRKELP